MDFTIFDKNFDELKTILRIKIDARRTHYGNLVYGNYLSYSDEVKIIVERIEEETKQFTLLSKKVIDLIRRNEELDDELLFHLGKNLTSLQLDIKSFFIFTKIFLDTLTRMMRLFYGKKGEQLPESMTNLLKSVKALELDPDFFEGLIERMSWYDEFVKRRDEIVHYLGGMRSTLTRDGDIGFDILGAKEQRAWGTDTVKSIIRYIEGMLTNLSEAIQFISSSQSNCKCE